MKNPNALRFILPALMLLSIAALNGYAIINVPGAVPASGCQSGAIMSTDQFTTTGFSQVRTVGPDDVAPAGAWVIADEIVPTTSVVPTPNCPGPLPIPDAFPLRVAALKLTPTIGSWQDADIVELQLIQDMNCDALYDPGVDLVMQTKSGQELRQGASVSFINGPASPLFVVGPAFAAPTFCAPFLGAQGIMVVVKIGPNPVSGTQFGLSLEGLSVDIPGLGPSGFSSGFSSSQNAQGSSIRLQVIGGGTGGPLPPPPPPGPPPPGPPPPGGSTLKSYDKNTNCKLDDPEFFNLIDGWISNAVQNVLFFSGVDAWIGQTSVCTAAASAVSSVEALQLQGVALNLSPTLKMAQFEARGQGIAATQVEVFGLNGKRVYFGEASGAQLSWNLRASGGHLLANGTYLYRVTVRGRDGQTLQSDVKKLVIVR